MPGVKIYTSDCRMRQGHAAGRSLSHIRGSAVADPQKSEKRTTVVQIDTSPFKSSICMHFIKKWFYFFHTLLVNWLAVWTPLAPSLWCLVASVDVWIMRMVKAVKPFKSTASGIRPIISNGLISWHPSLIPLFLIKKWHKTWEVTFKMRTGGFWRWEATLHCLAVKGRLGRYQQTEIKSALAVLQLFSKSPA